MRKSHRAAALAVSLIAHVAIFAAWFATRPPPPPAEPPVMTVELLRPPPRERPKPPPTRPTPPTASVSPQAAPLPSPIQPHIAPPSADAAPIAPQPLDTRRMTDQELIERAGPRPDIARLHADESRRPVFSRRLGPGPMDCKPPEEHSDRIAPRCPVFGGGPMPPPMLANRGALAAEGDRKLRLRDYKERYGPPGRPRAEDYPGLGCSLFHKC